MLTGVISYLQRLPARIQRHSRPQLLRLGGALIMITVAATLLARAPFLLAGLSVFAALWYLFAHRSGIPGIPFPPSSRIPFQVEYFSDNRFLEQQREKHGAVFTVRPLITPITCIADLDKGLEFLSVNDHRIEAVKPVFNDLIEKGFVRAMSGETHQKYKALLAMSVSQETIRQREDALHVIVSESLDSMHRLSQGGSGNGINPRAELEAALFRAWTLLFFGIEADSPLFDQIHRANAILDAHKSGAKSRKEAQHTLAVFCDDIIPAIMGARSTGNPLAGDNTSCFIANILENDRSCANDQTALANMVYMFNNSLRDMLGLCVWIVKMLADNPEWVSRARSEMLSGDNLSSTTGLSTASRIVLETLRLRQSEYIWRKSLEPIVFAGFAIPRGALIRICIRECHRDGRVFEQPARFNPDRFASRQYKRNEFCPLGAKRHACIGERLIMTMGRLLVEALARDYDVKKTDDNSTRFGTQGRHWEPGEKFRIELCQVN